MDKRRNPLKDPAKFREWLASKPELDFVGFPGDGRSCPLAAYVQETRSAHFVNIPNRQCWVVDNQYFTVPPWADQFIERIDKVEAPLITAGRALAILAAVEEAMAIAECPGGS